MNVGQALDVARRSLNAVVAWLLVGALFGLASVAYQRDAVYWAVLMGFVALVAVVPALLDRSVTRVPPWPLLIVAGLAPTTRIFGSGTVWSSARRAKTRTVTAAAERGYDVPFIDAATLDAYYLTGLRVIGRGVRYVTTFADAAALAAIALLFVALLQWLTRLRMTTGFGMLFVGVTTMGMNGFWAIVRWRAADVLGVAFVPTNEALMHEFAAAGLAGILVAICFGAYFGRARPETRVHWSAVTDGGHPATDGSDPATDGGDPPTDEEDQPPVEGSRVCNHCGGERP
ncbi:hypothetical protein [Haloarchaeobius sp. TZWWS8]|uniref:hypothetical protein n=1 Tax=Haloarchaeobius sp. TZWWS8 TaxID=3446121 RepID=UPI003EB7381C